MFSSISHVKYNFTCLFHMFVLFYDSWLSSHTRSVQVSWVTSLDRRRWSTPWKTMAARYSDWLVAKMWVKTAAAHTQHLSMHILGDQLKPPLSHPPPPPPGQRTVLFQIFCLPEREAEPLLNPFLPMYFLSFNNQLIFLNKKNSSQLRIDE